METKNHSSLAFLLSPDSNWLETETGAWSDSWDESLSSELNSNSDLDSIYSLRHSKQNGQIESDRQASDKRNKIAKLLQLAHWRARIIQCKQRAFTLKLEPARQEWEKESQKRLYV